MIESLIVILTNENKRIRQIPIHSFDTNQKGRQLIGLTASSRFSCFGFHIDGESLMTTIDNQAQSDEGSYDYRSLSDSQKQLLAVLPIPSATLSVLGSSVIIYMAVRSRKTRPWTPYNRLLVGLSVYDVITSIGLAFAAFLNPKESSTKAFAFGNEATCAFIGFVNQISFSGTFYNAMLSFYFLLTARFAMKNEKIAERIEPVMHFISLFYPTACGVVGLVLGVYAEPEVGIGCWVNEYPRNCGYGPGGTGETCTAGMIAWIFGGWMALFTLASLTINNLVIWVFVRQQTKAQLKNSTTKRSMTQMDESYQSEFNKDDGSQRKSTSESASSVASSLRTKVARSNDSDTGGLRAGQKRRLKLVSSQAFLFVASYIASSFSTYVLRLYESQATNYVGEMELPYNNYILLVFQAILYPLQGLLNMLVYVRPKYLKCRSGFPRESRFWSLRRAIIGDSVQPTHSMNEEDKHIHIPSGIPAMGNHVSSLTNGSGNSGGGDIKHNDPTRRIGSAGVKPNTKSSLDMISEISHEDDSAPMTISSQNGSGAATKRKGPSHIEPRGSNSKLITMDGTIVHLGAHEEEKETKIT